MADNKVNSCNFSLCGHTRTKLLYGAVRWCQSCGAIQDAELKSGWFLPHHEDLPGAYAGRMFEVRELEMPKAKRMDKLELRVSILVSDLDRWEKTMRELEDQVRHHVTPADATNAAAGAAAAALSEVADLRQRVLSAESATDRYDKQNSAMRKRLLVLEKSLLK